MALADGADPADRSRDRIASAEHRLARRHLIEDTVVVGASIAKTFHTLEKIETVSHLLIVKLICAKLVEIDERAKRSQLKKHSCRKIEVGIFRKNARDIGARRATTYLAFRGVDELSFGVGLVV